MHVIQKIGDLVGGCQNIAQVWMLLRYGTVQWLKKHHAACLAPAFFLDSTQEVDQGSAQHKLLHHIDVLKTCCYEILLLEYAWKTGSLGEGSLSGLCAQI